MKCKSCSHHRDAHDPNTGDCIQCGCIRFEQRDRAVREARLRTWVAKAEFFVKNRWIVQEVRVKAMGHGGAAMRTVREAKVLALKPRTRVAQVRITLTPVPRRKGGATGEAEGTGS